MAGAVTRRTRDSLQELSAHDGRMETDTIHLELHRGKSKMRRFRIAGFALGSAVVARWDGELLLMSKTLYEVVCLARAVDEVFLETEWEDRWRLRPDTPCLIALEILGGLDSLTDLDWEIVDLVDPEGPQS